MMTNKVTPCSSHEKNLIKDTHQNMTWTNNDYSMQTLCIKLFCQNGNEKSVRAGDVAYISFYCQTISEVLHLKSVDARNEATDYPEKS
mmetsp:Transcript_1226/g.2677  ORF Transcript_1226/g.2677 Transcript_1226/m.2677 type:complete len:88 (-) Transcript_1226:118-381(-)